MTEAKALLQTTHGAIEIEVFVHECPGPSRRFLSRCTPSPDADTPSLVNSCFHRIIHGLFIQCGHNIDKTNDEEEFESSSSQSSLSSQSSSSSLTPSTRKFHSAGICAFAPNSDDFIITLDESDALSTVKYTIFGRLTDPSVTTLSTLSSLHTDSSDFPYENPSITAVTLNSVASDFLASTPPGDITPDTPAASAAVTRTATVALGQKRQDTTNSDTLHHDVPSTPDPKRPRTGTGMVTPIRPLRSASVAPFPASFSVPSTPASATYVGSRNEATTPVHLPASPLMLGGQARRSATMVLDEQRPFMTPRLTTTATMDRGAHGVARMMRSASLPCIDVQQTRPKWPKRLVIVRHGQSEQNAALDLMQPDIDTLAGVRDADIRLTEIGEWQAQQCGRYLATTPQFDVCFTSPYTRTIQTAEHIISQLPYKLKLHKENWLREKEFGHLHGLTPAQVKAKFPQEYEIRVRDGRYWYRFPGGENYCDVELRLHCFLEKLSRDYAGRNVLVITHQVPYKMFSAQFQHLDEAGVLGLEAVSNCGVQEYLLDRLKAPEGRMKMKHFNYTPYDMTDCPEGLKGLRKPSHGES
eukprot:TRINITY_DN5370_c0_g1_i1.p1 TRINITY_DN5370_c0_g1~~TRINITY_DN5370_c0_g1_i1.p1  ORF type:complete len:583 (+),score=91.49 TRINITY_DN5370_c0_g1_i1:29-1777(+)